jgi:glycosyltransferase involved in cell wall biosynthesis
MIHALSSLVDEVVVFADSVDDGALPQNARPRRFAARTKVGRGLRFESALARELGRSPRPAAIVAHMCPIYAVLAAPLARPARVPLLLWYTHWYGGNVLRMAERVSTAVLTVDESSFPLRSSKVKAIGHAVDVSAFPCRPGAEHERGVRALALGRYSPVKGFRTIVRAIELARSRGVEASLTIRGPAPGQAERRERAELEALVRTEGLHAFVDVGDVAAPATVPTLFAHHDVLVNDMRPGAPDKVVYEAAAGCLPVIASNPAFSALLEEGFRFSHGDAAALADRLVAFAATTSADRARVGHELRRRVEEDHSVERWAERVMAAATTASNSD